MSQRLSPFSTAKVAPAEATVTAAAATSGEPERHPTLHDYTQAPSAARAPRPTMMELMHGSSHVGSTDSSMEEFSQSNAKIVESHLKPNKAKTTKPPRVKLSSSILDDEPTADRPGTGMNFGWVEGVLLRCSANILGVMLYLRMTWVAGQAGIAMGTAIVLMGSLVTTITALSMNAICTNGHVKGGGAYYLISRSLGPEYGGSIGIIFTLANTVGVAMYVVGAAEIIRDELAQYSVYLIDGAINDVRVIGFLTCLMLLAIVFIGLGFESKMQIVLIAIVAITIVDFWVGAFFPPNAVQIGKGMTGFSVKTFSENLYPSFRGGYNFVNVFAIYFPAATGIMAGANISGDLKNPTKAIPKGTLMAILVTTIIYLSVIWISGCTMLRDADGFTLPSLLGVPEALRNDGWEFAHLFNIMFGPGSQIYQKPQCFANSTCPYGLINSAKVFETISFWPAIIVLGALTSTLSSALMCLVSAPKIFQAVCKDKLFPYIGYFASGYGPTNEPRKAYLLAFLIAVSVVMIGDLNSIAPIISNFYLCTYVIINFACFDMGLAKSPGFRPSFRFVNPWVSLGGSLLCICFMFVISLFNALLTFMFFGLLYFYLSHRKPDVNWGSSTQAHRYRHALYYVQKLEHIDEHVKTYRPQILVLTANPAARPGLVDFANAITKGTSLLMCGHVVPYNSSDSVHIMMSKLRNQVKFWLRRRHIKAFYHWAANLDFRQGIQSLFQVAGLGRLRPNIVLVGYKQDWANNSANGLADMIRYFGVIQDAFDSQMAVCVLRNGKAGFDFSDLMQIHNLTNFPKPGSMSERGGWLARVRRPSGAQNILSRSSSSSGSLDVAVQTVVSLEPEGAPVRPPGAEEEESDADCTGMEPDKSFRKLSQHFTNSQVELLMSINKFQIRVKKGKIDVWWLYDDGGLTLLLPYLLTQSKSYLENAVLRVFTICASNKNANDVKEDLTNLLTQFRITFSEIIVISDAGGQPRAELVEAFNNLIAPYCESDTSPAPLPEGMISKTEQLCQQTKTWQFLRTVDYLHKYSASSDLIVMTLPVPRKNLVSAPMYLAWLDIISRDLPTTLFVRGNQTPVLTLYS